MVVVPQLIEIPGILDGILPVGLHHASLREIRDVFAYNEHRAWLFQGLLMASLELRKFGCSRLYLGGSYVTSKEYPGDYDACWDPAGVSAEVDPLLWDDTLRVEQNRKYRGDLLVSAAGDGPECRHFQWLAHDKVTGARKGMIGVKLNMLEIMNV
ncbi:MAG TPA: hypothetical protein VEZ20_05715 [Allosphingosinicella sp.]|nr:hypothetical protein [Allosphingosinicella sp.]